MSLAKKIFNFLDSFRSYEVFDRPIFIISAPRSGSTLLYELMLKFENVYGFSVEADHVWQTIFPRERLDDQSDLVSLDDYSPRKEKEFKRYLYRSLMWDIERRKKLTLTEKLALRKIRYIEKTISNCFHLEFIEKAFPDCYYIWLIRDPRAVVSSMLIGWKGSKRATFYKRRDPLKDRFDLKYFPYPLPPKWKNIMTSLREIDAFLWAYSQYVTYSSNFFQKIPKDRYLLVRYEALISDPKNIFQNITQKCSLSWSKNLEKALSEMPLSRTTLIKPSKDKWKKLHGEIFEIPDIKKQLLIIMDKLGY